MEAKIKINKVVFTSYFITVAVLAVAYLIEFLKGSRGIGYFLIFLAIDIIPAMIAFMIYRADKASDKVRQIVAYGFIAI